VTTCCHAQRLQEYCQRLPAFAIDVATARCKLPWSHNVRVLDRIKDRPTREWYLHAALEYGWSRDALVLQIKSGLHEREGKALTNFPRALLPLTLTWRSRSSRIPTISTFSPCPPRPGSRRSNGGIDPSGRDLLLELGRGFSFVGSQVPVTVDEQTFYIDLLFYHVRLHRYFVFELKVGAFRPEHAGKLGFYLAAVNRTMQTPVEGPSIGILLCESRSGPMVEFALENTNQPIGLSAYQVTRELPAPMQEELPSVEDLEEVVNKLRSEMETLQKEPPRCETRRSLKSTDCYSWLQIRRGTCAGDHNVGCS
jgi:predicted nuclease of restriction endonuclease-like (RecB) superfamily